MADLSSALSTKTSKSSETCYGSSLHQQHLPNNKVSSRAPKNKDKTDEGKSKSLLGRMFGWMKTKKRQKQQIEVISEGKEKCD